MGRLFVFDRCPFSDAHKDGAYAIQFDNGAIFAGCHHNSCGGGKQRWHELRERFEGKKKLDFEEWHKKQVKDRAKAKAEQYDGPGKGTVQENSDNSFALEAIRIMKEENPFEYLLKTFTLDHEGDGTVAECRIMSLASRSVKNSKGLHVLVTGESGKGKSHAFDTMMQQVPADLRLDGRLSDKALFYADDLRPGSAICLDDISLSDQMQEILKGVTTSFQRPFKYRTVDKDRKGLTRFIPERCVWWVAKMEGTGDGQVWNRMLTTWIDDSREQDYKVLERELESAMLPPQEEIIRPEISISRQIWQSIPDRWVIIPYANRIRFSSVENRRNPGMLIDIIRAHAILIQYQRVEKEYNGISCIVADEQDFRVASRLYLALNGESGGQMSKLTRSEAEIVEIIRNSGMQEIRIAELQRFSGKSHGAIYKMMHGSISHGTQYSGLLEKCPAISFLDRTDITEGGGTSRRMKVYVWDAEVYNSWVSGGGCWLSGSDKENDNDCDDDPGSGGNVEVSGRSAESFRLDRTEDSALKSGNNTNCTNKFLDNNNERNDLSSQEAPDSSCLCDSAFQISAQVGKGGSSGGDYEPLPRYGDNSSRGKFPLPSGKGGNLPPGEHRLTMENLHPDRFHKADVITKGPCDVCGRKWISYVENWYHGKDPGKPNLLVCERCMSKSVAREIMSVRTLPGTVNLSGLSKVNRSIGKCDICGVASATWSGQDIQICDMCYKRENRDETVGKAASG